LNFLCNVLLYQYTALRFCGFDDAPIFEEPTDSGFAALDKAFALTGFEGIETQNPGHRNPTGNSEWPKFIKKG
jgi:hypothetical protein